METKSNLYKRREFLKTLIGTGAVTSLMGTSLLSRCTTVKKNPNILLIFTDDQGIGDVSCYGSEIPTPNIDSIAQNGVKFEYFYTSAPVCTPSRYSLLTGRYPVRAGSRAFLGALMPGTHDDMKLAPDEVTLGDTLKEIGYKTALIGKWHLGHGSIEYGPNNHGFDYFYGFLPGCVDFYKHTYREAPAWWRNKELIEEEGYATDLLTGEAIKFIENNKNNPFFLYLAYNSPHYGKAPEGNLLQAPIEFHKKNPDATDREIYAAMVKSLDDGIGKVFETLKGLNLEENTLIIFISDNGGSLPYGGSNGKYKGQKGTLWEGGIKVPCLMQWKGKIKPGTVTKQVAGNVDILSTLLNITGTKLPDRIIDGIDISDVLLETKPRKNRTLLFKTKRESIVYREGDWKYLKDTDGTEYLFDLLEDPYENKNLVSVMPEKLKEMRAMFDEEIGKIEKL